ncbi:MAG TPA: MarR family transcriptional regulator [Streptosporangiaceae bacterium]|nr:MarR family transcriptional regulator [Streptosporangiaceae bacterium]
MRDKDWEAALDRILLLTVLVGKDLADGLAQRGLTEARAHMLWELHARGPCTQRVLASALHVTPRAITALVDGLVETGFVTREPSPADRRAVLVTFTEQGHAAAQELADSHRELARRLFADMPPGEFDVFDAGLSHVVTRLHEVTAASKKIADSYPPNLGG